LVWEELLDQLVALTIAAKTATAGDDGKRRKMPSNEPPSDRTNSHSHRNFGFLSIARAYAFHCREYCTVANNLIINRSTALLVLDIGGKSLDGDISANQKTMTKLAREKAVSYFESLCSMVFISTRNSDIVIEPW